MASSLRRRDGGGAGMPDASSAEIRWEDEAGCGMGSPGANASGVNIAERGGTNTGGACTGGFRAGCCGIGGGTGVALTMTLASSAGTSGPRRGGYIATLVMGSSCNEARSSSGGGGGGLTSTAARRGAEGATLRTSRRLDGAFGMNADSSGWAYGSGSGLSLIHI